MRYTTHILLALIALFSISCNKQTGKMEEAAWGPPATRSLPLVNYPQKLTFRHMDTDQGLSNNQVSCLLEDSKGYVWIGTDDGLNRYDGYSFTVFRHDPADSSSIPSSDILALCEDASGRIWVSTSGQCISSIDIRTKQVIRHPLPENQDSLMLVGNNAALFSVRDSLLFFRGTAFLDIHQAKYYPIHKIFPGYDYLHGICSKGDTVCWLLYNDTSSTLGVFLQTGKDNSPVKLFELDGILANSYCLDKMGMLWGGQQSGDIIRVNLQTGEKTIFPYTRDPQEMQRRPGGSIFHVFPVPELDLIWVSTWKGLLRMDLNKERDPRWVRYQHNPDDAVSLSGEVATCSIMDSNHNLWVGTMEHGLNVYSPFSNKFEVFRHIPGKDSSLPGHEINALAFDHGNRLWVGTKYGLCQLTDREKGIFRIHHKPRDSHYTSNHDHIRGMEYHAPTNSLFIAYWGYFPQQYHIREGRFVNLEETGLKKEIPKRTLSGQFVSQIDLEGDTLYLAYWGSAVSLKVYDLFSKRLNPYFGSCKMMVRDEGLSYGHSMSGLFMSVKKIAGGPVIVGTETESSLYFLFPDDRYPVFCEDSIFQVPSAFRGRIRVEGLPHKGDHASAIQPNIALRNALKTRKGQLWLASNQGLFLVQDAEKGLFQNYGMEAGFQTQFLVSLAEDLHGHIWVGSTQGLYCFDPESKRVIRKYDVHDGLPGNQFQQNAVAVSGDGHLAMGTTKGLILFHPDSILFNSKPPRLNLTDFQVNGEGWKYEDGITLPAGRNLLQFTFAAMDLSQPGQNRYAYNLRSESSEYSKPSTDNHVTFYDLSPGSYVLTVKACNADGIWNAEGLGIRFRILPPWYRTWWAMGALGLLLAGIGAFAWRAERNRFELRQKREQTIKYLQVHALQAQLNPHFIFNVLSTMQSKILNNEPQEASKMLVDLSKLIRNFLEASISTNFDDEGFHEVPLDKELELLEMYMRFERLKNDNRFSFQFDIDPGINLGNESLPPLLIQPYVENAIKHGILYRNDDQGMIWVRVYKRSGDLVFQVEDNGVGRTRAREIQQRGMKIYKSRGTQLIEQRVEIMNQANYNIMIDVSDRPGGGTLVDIQIGYKLGNK